MSNLRWRVSRGGGDTFAMRTNDAPTVAGLNATPETDRHHGITMNSTRHASKIRPLPPPPEMEQAVYGRDTSYDGLFLVAVRTTGIFCRPSCPARKPKRENMAFYGTPREALLAGFRPCRRCRPMSGSGRPPRWVKELLDKVEAAPEERLRDGDLRKMGVDPVKARRWFQGQYGLTFHAYARARRLGEALHQIQEGETLDETALDAGYESPSGFRHSFGRLFGKTPGRSRDADCVRTRILETPLGPMVAGAVNAGICLLEFTDRRMLDTQMAVLRKRFKAPVIPGGSPALDQLESELAEYFAGRRKTFDVPLVTPGTPFQTQVWDQLRKIGYGVTCSYEEVARRIGRPAAVRAVGHANGQNRIAIVIPCHRVVNKDGGLGGYGGGLRRKEALLAMERGGGSITRS